MGEIRPTEGKSQELSVVNIKTILWESAGLWCTLDFPLAFYLAPQLPVKVHSRDVVAYATQQL